MARFRHQITVWTAALAIFVFAAASVRVPPPVDAAMAERAVTGAEWLAERAAEAPEQMAEAEGTTNLIGWLLVAGGANWSEGYANFAAYLAVDGYDDAEFAVGQWLNEFRRVLAAHQAAQLGGALRPLSEIEVELSTLPTVPLDEAGAFERDRLRTELTLAAIPLSERAATEGAAERIEALIRLSGLGGGQ